MPNAFNHTDNNPTIETTASTIDVDWTYDDPENSEVRRAYVHVHVTLGRADSCGC